MVGARADASDRGRAWDHGIAGSGRRTTVVFPNYDSVFHNVLSPTGGHPFDLGSYRAGDVPKSVEMTATGVIDVFCNMHSHMHAS